MALTIVPKPVLSPEDEATWKRGIGPLEDQNYELDDGRDFSLREKRPRPRTQPAIPQAAPGMKCGGKVKMAKGGSVRGSGCAVRGVKKCKMR